MPVREITVTELDTALQSGAPVVDVRETNEYLDGHVPGAVHVALGTVPDRVDAFRSDGTTYVICRSGARSMRACEFLAQQGLDVVNVAGGTLDWVAGGRPVVTGSSPL
jgi:rhodanese-related sulfurtransferase